MRRRLRCSYWEGVSPPVFFCFVFLLLLLLFFVVFFVFLFFFWGGGGGGVGVGVGRREASPYGKPYLRQLAIHTCVQFHVATRSSCAKCEEEYCEYRV